MFANGAEPLKLDIWWQLCMKLKSQDLPEKMQFNVFFFLKLFIPTQEDEITVWCWLNWSNKWVALRLVVATGARRCRLNRCFSIIVHAAELIPNNWCCLCFWHQVLIYGVNFPMSLSASPSKLIKKDCDWWIAVLIMCQVPLKWVENMLRSFVSNIAWPAIWLLFTYITMLKQCIAQL